MLPKNNLLKIGYYVILRFNPISIPSVPHQQDTPIQASTASAPPPMQSFAYIAFIFLEATVGSVAKKFVKLQSKT